MDETFENYLKQARNDFAKVAGKYTVTEYLELRAMIDSLLITYNQAVAKALILPVVVKSVKEKRITFTKWTELNKYYEKDLTWFNENGNQRNYNDLLDMYLEEYPL